MKKMVTFMLGILILAASGCAAGVGRDSYVWIDQPLDGALLDLRPTVITAHASSGSGVAGFQIYVDDQLVHELDAHGGRMETLSWEWQPETPGQHRIRVVAVDALGAPGGTALARLEIRGMPQDRVDLTTGPSLGGTIAAAIDEIACGPGSSTTIHFTIFSPLGIVRYAVFSTWVAVQEEQILSAPFPKNVSDTVVLTEPVDDIDRQHQWGLLVEAPGSAHPFYAYAFEPNLRCPGHYAGATLPGLPPTVNPTLLASTPPALAGGQKVTAKANATCRQGPNTGFDPVGYIAAGDAATASGRLANNTWLQVRLATGAPLCWVAANLVSIRAGTLDQLPVVVPPSLPTTTATAVPTSTATPTLVPDTTPPSIVAVSANPTTILTEGNGCSSYSRTTQVQASVADPGGVGAVIAFWSVGGESGQVTMQPAGGQLYQGTVGPVGTTGSLSIVVQASDASNNTASAAPVSVTVQACIE
jgi:hypothetical protein